MSGLITSTRLLPLVLLLLLLCVGVAPGGASYTLDFTPSANGRTYNVTNLSFVDKVNSNSGSVFTASTLLVKVNANTTSDYIQYIYRSELLFDTSSLSLLPAGTILRSAEFDAFTNSAKTSTLGSTYSIIVDNYTPISYSSVLAGDHTRFRNNNFGELSYSNIGSGWNNFTLNNDFIQSTNLTGNTPVMLRVSWDRNASFGGTWASAGASGTTYNGTGNLVDIPHLRYTYDLPPVASFGSNYVTATAPAMVHFYDTSSETPSSWLWDFGDGETSTSKNPFHYYMSAGVYTVSLQATNIAGTDTETSVNYVTITANPSTNPNTTIYQISDTQYLASLYNKTLNEQYAAMEARKSIDNVSAIIHTGDIVDDWNIIRYWDNATTAMNYTTIPEYYCVGNHDMGGWKPGYDYTNWDAYMGADRHNWSHPINGNMNFICMDYYNLSIVDPVSPERLSWWSSTINTSVSQNKFPLLAAHDYYNAGNGHYSYMGVQIRNLLVNNNISTLFLSGHAGDVDGFDIDETPDYVLTDETFDLQYKPNLSATKIFTVIQNPLKMYGISAIYSRTWYIQNNSETADVLTWYPPELGAPTASFTAAPTSGTAPLSVQFTDTSAGSPTSWEWGGLNTTPGNNTWISLSTDQDPVIVFGTGLWKINLTATNAYGSDTTTDDYYIDTTEHTGMFEPIIIGVKNVIDDWWWIWPFNWHLIDPALSGVT